MSLTSKVSGTKASDMSAETVNTADLAETVVCSMKYKVFQHRVIHCGKTHRKDKESINDRKRKLTADY